MTVVGVSLAVVAMFLSSSSALAGETAKDWIEWSRKREVVYVPRVRGAEFAAWHDRGQIPAATGVAFVVESKLGDGLDVVHESLLWKGRTFLHATVVRTRGLS